jgi:uncharacterized membrane-anchored protein
MGEAISDWLVNDVNQYLGVVLGFIFFVIAMIWQFRTPTYRTGVYWFAVSMVAVFGTMAADVVHVVLGLPYAVSSTGYAILLAAVLITWYASERTLSIHTIVTPRREAFYWLTVVFTFAMGTAVGDLTAHTLHLGYLSSGIMFTIAIGVPLLAWRLGMNPVLTFWVAYILTRPIGASFADYFGFGKKVGGLGVGHGLVSLVTVVIVVALVWYMGKTGKDLIEPRGGVAADGPGYDGQRPGHDDQRPGYDGRPGHGVQPGYSAQRGYRAQPEYEDQGYGQQSPPPGW